MKKLKLQVQTSIDGFVADPNGELDWMVWDWDDALNRYTEVLTNSVDTLLMGRGMVDGFMTHWSRVAENPDDPSHADGKRFVDMPKVVFTNTLTESTWKNTRLATGDLMEEVNRLKNQSGKDLIVYGGASFVSALIAANLIDEYHLFINPTVLGTGLPIFREIGERRQMTLVKSIGFDCGITVQCYESKQS